MKGRMRPAAATEVFVSQQWHQGYASDLFTFASSIRAIRRLQAPNGHRQRWSYRYYRRFARPVCYTKSKFRNKFVPSGRARPGGHPPPSLPANTPIQSLAPPLSCTGACLALSCSLFIGKRNLPLNARATQTARDLRQIDSRAARWIASDALRELTSEKVQARLTR